METFNRQHTLCCRIISEYRLACSLPVSTVQRPLQKAAVWRDRSHHHEPARSKHAAFLLLVLLSYYYHF